MATADQIRDALSELEPGTDVILTTRSGDEIYTTYDGDVSEDRIKVENSDSVEIEDLEGIKIPVVGEGPE